MHLRVGLRARMSSHGAGRSRRIRAYREFARQQLVNTTLVHHQQYDIGLRATDLKSDASALDPDGTGGRPPAVLLAAPNEALAVFPTDDECALLQPRHDHDTFSLVEEVLRDA